MPLPPRKMALLSAGAKGGRTGTLGKTFGFFTMKFLRWFGRDGADPVALVERLVRAIVYADMRQLKKLVWRNYAGWHHDPRPLPGRDGFLQFVNSLRPAHHEAQDFEFSLPLISGESVIADIRVHWKDRDFDRLMDRHYLWQFSFSQRGFFPRRGQLVRLHVMDWNDKGSIFKYPVT
jgi:hypothetical protein